jgi:ABC-type phosphate transport system auxiliary subunit
MKRFVEDVLLQFLNNLKHIYLYINNHMATKTEKIAEDIIDNIKNIQSDVNGYIFDLGQLSVRSRELELESKRILEIKKQIEDKLDNQSLQLENVLSDLQRKYKNAEIDLNDGTVTFEVSE